MSTGGIYVLNPIQIQIEQKPHCSLYFYNLQSVSLIITLFYPQLTSSVQCNKILKGKREQEKKKTRAASGKTINKAQIRPKSLEKRS